MYKRQQESLENSQTLYEVNQQKLIQAESQLQQAKDSIHDIAMKENEIELVNTEVQRAKIALDEVEERLEETEIFAPITGVIIEKLVEVGQIIASGISNVNGGTALATIADMSRLFIIADIDETDIGSVRIGQNKQVNVKRFIMKDTIEHQFYNKIYNENTIPLSIGGDHLVSLPILRALASKEPVGLFQFDSHTDTYDTYFGGHKYTHGTPFRRAIEENLVDPKKY